MSHHLITAGLGVDDLVLAAAKKTTPTSSASTFIFLILIFGLAYVVFIRPRQRMRRQQQQQSPFGVGDEVMLTSGIVGTIVGMSDDRAQVEIAPGVEIEVVRAALGRKLSDGQGVQEEPYEPTEPDPGADGEDWPHTSDMSYGDHDGHADVGDEHDVGDDEDVRRGRIDPRP